MAERNVIKEAVSEVAQLRAHALENAKLRLESEMQPRLRKMINKRISEELGGGGDPPGSYDSEGIHRKDGEEGEPLSDDGDGSPIIEGDDDMDKEKDMVDKEEDMVDEDEEIDFEDDEEDLAADDGELSLGGEEEVGFGGDDMGGGDDVEFDLGDESDDDLDVEEDGGGYGAEEEKEEEEIEEEIPMEASLKRENAKLKKECIRLRNESKKLKRAVAVMREAVQEVNLFNARLAGTQQLTRKFKLTEAQMKRVVLRFDDCDSINEVKKMYRALNEGYSSVQRKIRKFKINRPNTQSTSSRNLTESNKYSRMNQLAGTDR